MQAVCEMALRELLLLLLLLLLFTTASAQGQCDYQFISQPSSESDQSCNPWPYINHNNGTLVLECVIIGPQNTDTPHAMWFVRNNTSQQSLHIYFDMLKYSDPIMNADIGDGLRRVDFVMSISNVSKSDVGCYWCKVEVHGSASECTVTLLQSSAFCLRDEDLYSHLNDCSDLPTNKSITCAGNVTCPVAPDVITTLSTSQNTSFRRGTTTVSVSPIVATQTTELFKHSTPFTEHLVSTSVVLNVAAESTQPTTGNVQSGMVVGLYTGTTVCIFLLAIIILLVVVLVLLVRKKVRRPKNTSPNSSGTSWCNPSIEHSTSSSNTSLLATTFGVTPPTHNRLPHPVLPPPLIASGKMSVMDGRESPTSFHYYHVLERPRYYNIPVFQEDDSIEDWEGVLLIHTRERPALAARPGGQRHVYRELEQSTMEPKREYSKLVLKSTQ